MKAARLAALWFALVSLSACASVGLGHKKSEENRVLNRAEHYCDYMRAKNSGNLYDLLTPPLRKSIKKSDYVKDADRLFKHFTYYCSNPKVVLIEKKVAVVQSDIRLVGVDINILDCRRTIWLRYPDGWYTEEDYGVCNSKLPSKDVVRIINESIPDR